MQRRWPTPGPPAGAGGRAGRVPRAPGRGPRRASPVGRRNPEPRGAELRPDDEHPVNGGADRWTVKERRRPGQVRPRPRATRGTATPSARVPGSRLGPSPDPHPPRVRAPLAAGAASAVSVDDGATTAPAGERRPGPTCLGTRPADCPGGTASSAPDVRGVCSVGRQWCRPMPWTVRQECQVMRSITAVIPSPMSGSAIGTPAATTAADAMTASET